MDRNDLEKERGITILAKCTSVLWNDTRINIVDTPGHADFGGEVERILNMVDGAIVLVDAAEGVLPQTKFVVGKALARGHPPDRGGQQDRPPGRPRRTRSIPRCSTCSPRWAPTTASSISRCCMPPAARAGPTRRWTARARTCRALFDLVVSHVPPPTVDRDAPFAMVASILEYDNFLGRVLTGRIEQGRAKVNMPVKVLRADGSVVETGRLTKLLSFRGLERVPVDEAEAGDIIAVAGLSEATIPDTIGAPGTDRAAAGDPGRSADPGDDLPHQRRPAGRPRGQEGHLAADPRAAVPRGRGQRRHQGHRRRTRPTRSRSPAAANCSLAC